MTIQKPGLRESLTAERVTYFAEIEHWELVLTSSETSNIYFGVIDDPHEFDHEHSKVSVEEARRVRDLYKRHVDGTAPDPHNAIDPFEG